MLSTGEKERLAIASALALNPKLLILDEPTIGQDVENYKRMVDLIKQLKKDGKSVLIISHDLKLIKDVCDKVYLMKNGELLKTVDPKDDGWYEWSL
jgi:energy-coupling factor transport system ATP-binding protein